MDGRKATSPGGALLAVSSLAHFVNDGTTWFVPVIAALLIKLRGFSAVEVTTLFALYYVTSSTLGLLIGWLADRRGRTVGLMATGIGILAFGVLGFYLVLAGSVGSFGFPVALASAVITGFATSFYHPLGASILQQSFDPSRRGFVLGINGAFGSLGRALYPVFFFVAALVLVTSDTILLFAAVGAIAAILIGVTAWNDRPTRQTSLAAGAAVPREGLVRNAVTGGIVRLTSVAFVRSVATQGVAVWIPVYLTVARGVPASGDLGLAVAVLFAGGILGQLFFGLTADRMDKRYLIGASSAGAAFATFGYLVTTGLAAQGLLFAIGFCTFSAFPLLMSLSSDYVPSGSSTLANATVFGLGSGGGGVVGPLIVGAIVAGGYRLLSTGFAVMAGIGLVAAVAAIVVLPPGGRGRAVNLFG